MAKQYHLATGNNIGIYDKTQSFKEKMEDYVYSEDLIDFFSKNSNPLPIFRKMHRKETAALISCAKFKKLEKQYYDPKSEEYTYSLEQLWEIYKQSMGEELLKTFEAELEEYKQSLKPIIDSIQNVYKKALTKTRAKTLKIVDGKAIMDGQYLIHSAPMLKSLEDYESRKDLGIIASEFFGKPERMDEGHFCSFFTKYDKILPKPIKNNLASSNMTELKMFTEEKNQDNNPSSLEFIIDASDPAVKEMLDNDFFQYVRNKTNKDYLSNLNKQQIDMFEYILSLSRVAQSVAVDNPNWVAIPGGIPPQFIIGIRTVNVQPNTEAEKTAIAIAKYFGVPLIHPTLEVVYNHKTKQKLLEEDAALFTKQCDVKQRIVKKQLTQKLKHAEEDNENTNEIEEVSIL